MIPSISKAKSLLRKVKRKLQNQKHYQKWITGLEASYPAFRQEQLAYQPKISVLVPVYNVEDRHLTACIASVQKQLYGNWELCLVDDCSTWDNVKKNLLSYQGTDERIKVVFRESNGHISECTNTALEHATGEFIALLDCDDTLSPNALSEVAMLLNKCPDLDFIYSDEDKIDESGRHRFMPHFKPDWSPDTLMSHMYTCHLGVYRTALAKEIHGERKGYEGAQDYDFTLRFTEKTSRIAHIPKVLYHWRTRKESTAGRTEAKPYVLEAAKKSRQEALERRGLKARLEFVPKINQYRVNYLCDKYPKISVIIPSKDHPEVLERCLQSFTEITDYPDYELIVVDNGSNEENRKQYIHLTGCYHAQYLYKEEPFNFSHMCNWGSKAATGSFLLFLNDDMEIVSADWLKRMAGHAVLPHTGAVGAKLLYPDHKTIQHVGVICIDNGPIHPLAGFDDSLIYYFGRNILDYNQLAVTGACLLIRKEKFEQVGQFDKELKIAYNDVELCFRLNKAGYYNIVRNDVVLIHHESLSRGNDLINEEKRKRLDKERALLYRKHPEYKTLDPFYNRNLTQNRNDFRCNFDRITE